MKKLKRRLSHAFRSSYKPAVADEEGAHISGHQQQLADSFHTIDLNGSSVIHQNYRRANYGTNNYQRKGHGSQGSLTTLEHSDSLNHLSLGAECTILEEGGFTTTSASGIYRRRDSHNQLYPPNHPSTFIPDRPIMPQRPVSFYGGNVSSVCEYPNCEPQILIRPKSRRTAATDVKSKHKSFTEHLVGSLKKTGRPLFGYHRNKAVVHETHALGSDGESIEVSPCTSDQMSTSSHGHSSCGNNGVNGEHHQQRYIPNVKLRPKPNNRKWSEQDIQKRLSLPADIKLPQNVVEKLNRTPTLDNPLTRKSRRASLSEIGFGKLETYKKMFDLGEGTYATVYLGESLLTGKAVALKEIRLEHEEGAPCTAIREVSLLRNLKHANVVTLHDIIYTDRILTLVFEYVEHDLRDYMEEVDTMIVMNNVKLFLVQLLRGLAYCHKRRVLHRDLKPQNLLINNNGELKLADFGLARAQSVPTKTYSNEVVTLWYRPPDVLLGSKEYSSHIDMWGVGCILYEMLTRKAMFPGSTTDEQLNLIFSTLGPPTPQRASSLFDSPNFKQLNFRPTKPKPLTKLSPRIDNQSSDLLEKFLKYEGRERISAADAMHHQFLSNFPSGIFLLGDNESILSVPGVRYIQETFVHSRNLPMVHSSTSMNGFNQPKQTFQKHT